MSLVLNPVSDVYTSLENTIYDVLRTPRHAISAASRLSPVSRSSFQDLSPSVSQVFPSVADG